MAFGSGILGMFARSPIHPMQLHMESAYECVALLIPFFDAVMQSDWEQAKDIREQITQAEHKADELKMDFRMHLPKGLFLPVARVDLLELLSEQECLANTAKDISGIVIGRQMEVPQKLHDHFKIYLHRSIDAVTQAKKAINELDELLESGFHGKEVKFVDNMVQELNSIEKDTDQLQVELRALLFAIEKILAPVDVVFLYKIIDWIGSLADCAQRVGSRLQTLTA